MIACAIRHEIQRFLAAAEDRLDPNELRRCGLVAVDAIRGAPGSVGASCPPALMEQLAAADDDEATALALLAFAEFLAVRVGIPNASLDRAEAALDRLDDLVQEPVELNPLRQRLRAFLDVFMRICLEAHRAPRRPLELQSSAA